MTANELFGAISPGLASRILEDVYTSDKDLYRAAMAAIAPARKVRPVFLERQSRPDRHKFMASALGMRSLEPIAGNLLSGWLVKHQSTMLAEFLDFLKIKHEKGVVEDLPKTVPDDELEKAVEDLLTRHDPEVASLYLHAFFSLNEASWPHLELILTDPRLKLGAKS
jgi:hypothetical protein